MANNILTMRDREQDRTANPFLGMPKEQLEALEAQVKQQGGGGGIGTLAAGAETAGDIFLGLGGAPQAQASPLDELIKLETLKSKRALDQQTQELNKIKIQTAQKKLQTEGGVISEVGKLPPLSQQDITIGGDQVPPVAQDGVTPGGGLPTDIQPGAPVIDQVQFDTAINNFPSGTNPNEPLADIQLTGLPTLDSIVSSLNNVPLMIDSVKETIDNTGKRSRTVTKNVNPLVTKQLEAELSRAGKLDDVSLKILEKGLQERATNTRNSNAIEALLQNNTATWKAAKAEKDFIPNIPVGGGRESAILKRAAGKVAETFDITGFSWTKAYVGQRFETAMALSKIITGGSRIIKSVIQALLKTLPVDNGIVDDMEALTTQSISNSVARATGRPLTEEEMQTRNQRITVVLDTPAATVPGGEVRDSRIVTLNGVNRNVKYSEFEDFIDSLKEDDTLEFPELEPTE